MTYTSVLVNLAVESGNDGALVTNANAGGGNASYQMVGFDAHGASRNERRLNSFNFFARNSPTSSQSFSGSNRRWLAVVDGSTRKVLYNKVLPNSFSPLPAADVAEIREAVNMAELPVAMDDFSSWAAARIVDEGLRGTDDDPDFDGMTNLFEYAYGTDPSVADSEKGPRIIVEDGVAKLRYQRSLTALVAPLSIIGGESPASELAFDTDGLEETGEAEGGNEQVTVTLPSSLGSRFFLRLTTIPL